MTNRTPGPHFSRGRRLLAAVSAAALAASGALAAPAAADPPSRGSLDSKFDRATAQLDKNKITTSVREARGQITAFVQLRAESGVDLAEKGRSRAQVRAQERKITALADELVPGDASARSRSAAPKQLAVTTNLVAGVMVIGDAAKIRTLAADDDVVAVYRIVPKSPANKGTNSFTRAIDTWQSTGRTGAGVKVGIIDTGLDYTHASFGGEGTTEAYEAAYGTDGTGPIPADSFDPAKFAGGYDFAGPTYNGSSNPVPTPDENPIDNLWTSSNSGHGTHVAGTTGGYGVTADGETFDGDYTALTSDDVSDFLVGPGSAPEVELYGLKVFGDAGGSTGLVIQALEWSADPNGDGDFNDRLDILNLSLGSDGSPADDPENLFIDRLAQMGVLSVIASGNGGDVTDIGGSPGNANSALTVANSVGGSQTFDAVEVTDAPDAGLVGTYSAQNSVSYTGTDDAVGEVVGISATFSGCAPFTPEQAALVAGKIAYLYWNDQDAALECGSAARFNNAAAAGAIGVLLSSQTEVFSAGIAGNAAIPGAQLTQTSTQALQAAILAGGVEAVVGPSLAGAAFQVNSGTADLINPSSSRGVHGSLGVVKPDVAAPGTNIASAASGGATAASVLTGTSMATPHVAGIAALVAEANPGWAPAQVKAAVMNTATNDLFAGPDQSGATYGPERVGSGRVDALSAVEADTIAHASENPEGVSVTFGVVEVGDTAVTLQQTVTVRNLSDTSQTYSTAFVDAADNATGVISVTPSSITVPAGQSRLVTVRVTLDPATLERAPDPTQDPIVNVAGPMVRDFTPVISGWLEVTPYDEDALRVPVHVSPKRVSDLSGSDVALGAGDAAPLTLSGKAVDAAGWISLAAPLELVATSPRLERSGAVTSDSVIASGDIRYAGFASDVPTVLAGGGTLDESTISIGLATDGDWASLGSAMIPLVATDIDGDGTWDLETAVYRPDPAQDQLWALTFAVAAEDASGSLEWGDLLDLYPVNWGTGIDLGVFDNNQVVVPLSPGWVGMSEGDTPTFRIQTYSPYAEADNGVIDEVSFTADPFTPNYLFSGDFALPTHVYGDDGGTITVHRTASTPAEGQLLLLHTLNGPGERAQVVDVTADVAEEPVELAESTTKLVLKPKKAKFGKQVTAQVTVKSEGHKPTGTVTLKAGNRTLGEAQVVTTRDTAKVKILLPRNLRVGKHVITASYSGDDDVAASEGTAQLTVTKGKAKVKALAAKKQFKHGARPKIAITVRGPAGAPTPTGKITVKVGKKTLRATLRGGKATVRLPKLVKKSTKVKVTYAGTKSTYGKAKTTITVKAKAKSKR